MGNSSSSSKTLKRLWQDPEYREKMSKIVAESNSRRWRENEKVRQSMSKAISESNSRRWRENYKVRKSMSNAISAENRRRWEDPAFREKMSNALKKRWQDPVYREKILAGLKKPRQKAKITRKTQMLAKIRSERKAKTRDIENTKKAKLELNGIKVKNKDVDILGKIFND